MFACGITSARLNSVAQYQLTIGSKTRARWLTRLVVTLSLLIGPCLTWSVPFSFESAKSKQELSWSNSAQAFASPRRGLMVVNYVAWWSLDPEGYHPTILLKLENDTGKDLTAHPIRMQGRFMDLRTTIVTVARDSLQGQFLPGQRLLVWLRGPQTYELPLNSHDWPNMECKVMARIGDVGDEGTQTLVISNVERMVMSDDDARLQLEKLREFTQGMPQAEAAPEHEVESPKALTAAQGKLKAQKAPVKQVGNATAGVTSPAAFLSGHHLPGLGADFQEFEQAFGLPVSTETDNPGWTWAVYKQAKLDLTIYTGSRGRSGKVDVLVIHMPGAEALSDNAITLSAQNLSGNLKGPKISQLTHSVRYLPSGRTKLIAAQTSSYKLSYHGHRSSQDEGASILGLSRVPGTVDAFLAEQAKHVSLLRPLEPFFEL